MAEILWTHGNNLFPVEALPDQLAHCDVIGVRTDVRASINSRKPRTVGRIFRCKAKQEVKYTEPERICDEME